MDLKVAGDSHFLFVYKLKFTEKYMLEFPIYIDKATNNFIPVTSGRPAPAWTALDHQQCSNCPLHKADTLYCPVASNLAPLVDLCGEMASYENVSVEIVTPERNISIQTTAQRVVSSILGLIIATSPCPHTEYFKPMARFHLPMASEDETIYRTSSMYLLAQYLLCKDGKANTSDLTGLTQIYADMKVVNRALARRLRAAINEDAAVNGIILLDLLTQSVTWSIEDGLEGLRYLFKRYGVG